MDEKAELNIISIDDGNLLENRNLEQKIALVAIVGDGKRIEKEVTNAKDVNLIDVLSLN